MISKIDISSALKLSEIMAIYIYIGYRYTLKSFSLAYNYEWAKRTKFLQEVIYGLSRRHSDSSKTFKKNWRKKLNKGLWLFLY